MDALADLAHAIAIVLLAVVAAVAYGVLHDLVTASVCVEYFTVGHPNLLGVDPHEASPIGQALLWGVIATWWVGLLLGLPGALLARVGSEPKLVAADLVRPIGGLLLAMAGCAGAAFAVAVALAMSGVLVLPPDVARLIPESRHVGFLANGWAHGASYLAGTAGGVVLWGRIVATRVERALDLGRPAARS